LEDAGLKFVVGSRISKAIEFDLTTDALPIRIGEAQVLTQ
jgi:hypothetical protein